MSRICSLLKFTLVFSSWCYLGACGPDDSLWELDPVTGERSITHGTSYSGHPSVGYLMVPKGVALGLCSATLVGDRTVLTAAHCIPGGQLPTFVLWGYQHHKASKAIPHPSFNNYTLANDIGVVILQKAPTGVTPSVVSRLAPTNGLKIQLVGYGITSDNAQDAGVKRMAYNYIKQVYSTRFSFTGSGGGIGNTCQGDSGGPAFAILGGKEVVAGVTSGGTPPCGSSSFDTRVDAFYSWLHTNSGGDLSTGKPDVENPKVKISSPASGTKLIGAFTLKATASDDIGVASVELQAGGKVLSRRTAEPWEFALKLPVGQHTIKAVARDRKGKAGQDQITVEVVAPMKYGSPCGDHKHCASGMCARDPDSGTKYCTQKCDGTNNDCPRNAECIKGGTTLFVCGPPQTPADDGGDGVEGSCSVGPSRTSLVPVLLLFLMVLLASRRPGHWWSSRSSPPA